MKKQFITALLSVAMLLNLVGCNSYNSGDVNSNSDISNISENSGDNTGGNSEEISKPDESVPEEDKGEPTFLVGPDGEPIYTGEITSVTDGEGNAVTFENVKSHNFSEAICDGFCYLSEPTGISSNQLDNPDKWNGPMQCLDVPEKAVAADFKRLKVGDTFCGLKIKNANSKFFGDETRSFLGSNVEFEGELTLTGYISINEDNTYSVGVGDLQFVIDDKSAVLPGSWDYSNSWASDDYSTYFSYEGFYLDSGKEELDWYWGVSEYGLLYLGNIDTCTADISDIGSRDFCSYKVKVKINNLKIGSYPELSNYPYRYYADLIELEAID